MTIVVTNIKKLQELIQGYKEGGRTIGFTPTMGALHEGHFSLIKRSTSECDISICSIFVNPTQFDNASDLDNYPQTLEQDIQGLDAVGCHVLFAPTVQEMYPEGMDDVPEIDLQGLDRVMEGAHRPGHFAGVVQVVKLLLDIIDCDRLYMGQKDYQQFTIVRQILVSLNYPVQLVVCDISRDPDGLARSSRNRRLTPELRERAHNIYDVLVRTRELIDTVHIEELKSRAMAALSIPGFRPEYFDIVDGYSLQPIHDKEASELIVACTAVWAGEVRLIDNMVLRGNL